LNCTSDFLHAASKELEQVPRWKNVLKTSDEVHRIKRNAVLREATRIIARRGFHNTSLDDIAAALQVSKGTLYNYVADKQEILFECHLMAFDMAGRAYKFAAQHEQSGYGKLRLMLRTYVRWLNAALGGGGVTAEVSALRPSDRRTIIAKRDRFDSRLTGLLKEGMNDGTIRPVDPKLAVFTVMGAVNAVQSWYSPNGRLTIDQIADGMVDLLLHGLAGGQARKVVDVVVPGYEASDWIVPDGPGPLMEATETRKKASEKRARTVRNAVSRASRARQERTR
jgi:AcrR family transcriptional regulator